MQLFAFSAWGIGANEAVFPFLSARPTVRPCRTLSAETDPLSIADSVRSGALTPDQIRRGCRHLCPTAKPRSWSPGPLALRVHAASGVTAT